MFKTQAQNKAAVAMSPRAQDLSSGEDSQEMVVPSNKQGLYPQAFTVPGLLLPSYSELAFLSPESWCEQMCRWLP